MRLRIISGAQGGRFIDAPSGSRTRPTSQRVREAWFSALGGVEGVRLVDLCAGSGALGIEALSRGAGHVHFVESEARAYAMIRRNLQTLDLAERATLVRVDALKFVDRTEEPFDLALADPPYESGVGERLLRRFGVKPFADWLWLEHDAASGLSAEADWTRRYGDTALSAFHGGPDRGRPKSHPRQTRLK